MTINPDGRAINFLAACSRFREKRGILSGEFWGILPGKALRNQNWCARLKIVSACGGTVQDRRASVKRNISRKRTAAICGGAIVQKWGPCVAAVYII